MSAILDMANGIVWGAPALLMILAVGCYLSVRLKLVQLRLLPEALRLFFRKLTEKQPEAGISPVQALCTALAATVGTGNLVGVAGAICLGGPGAIFWMWICGLLGMVTKYAEAVLAVRYRICRQGEFVGGPMYIITQAMPKKFHWLAGLYSLFGVIACFGIGNAAQVNAALTGMNALLGCFGIRPTWAGNLLMGLALALGLGSMLLAGARGIAQAAQKLVPFAAVGYLVMCLGVLLVRLPAIPAALRAIVQGAFSPGAVTGGIIASAFQALRTGCSRGVFTNEAGMGTASIAHASAQVSHPVQQGMMGIVEVFLDTIVICTVTALVILVSGVPIAYGTDLGGQLTGQAFFQVYGVAGVGALAGALVCFAVATVLGWSLYGARCAQFLLGPGAWKGFVLVQTAAIVLSCVLDTGTVWQLSETVNGMMVIPNLLVLAYLTPEVVRLTKEYRKPGAVHAGGGTYANFHQCKSL